MGRIVGDGGTALQIVDIAVHPDYQGQGYGRTIMEHIMQYVHDNAVKGTYVSLMADYPLINCMKNLVFNLQNHIQLECIFYFKHSKRRPRQCSEDAFSL